MSNPQYLNTSFSPALRRNHNGVRFKSDRPQLGPISSSLMLAVLVCILGLMYLTQVTKTSAYGYEVDALKNQKEQLIEENQSLSVEAARLQALERIRKSKVASNLEDVTNVEYVNP